MRNHHIPSRPHLQGDPAPLRLRHSAQGLTDAGGLVLLRRVWDVFGIGQWLDAETRRLPGVYRPSLLVEVWVALLLYGGGAMDHLRLLGSRGLRRIFGWARIPDPTTFGRWLRRCGEAVVPVMDRLLWAVVHMRWAVVGVPRRLTVVLDSTVSVRYGLKQAGAEKGYNPKKPGRPSHHPLLAFAVESLDCLGVLWRPGSAHTAAGAEAWVTALVLRLRAAGVEVIELRLDKGFFSKEMVRTLDALGVPYYLKVPNWGWVRARLGEARRHSKSEELPEGREIWTASASLYGARLLSVQWRKREEPDPDGQTSLVPRWKVIKRAHVLTNVEGIHALSAWRRYNRGAVVEQRIEELGQLGVGKTAVDDLGGNALLWSLGALAYQLLHVIRTTALSGSGPSRRSSATGSFVFPASSPSMPASTTSSS